MAERLEVPMMARDAEYDLLGIGRPFTDVVAEVDDDFLARFDLPKGRGVDVSVPQLIRIKSDLEACILLPGGSASNTAAGVAALGGKAIFFGKLCDDANGRVFRNAFRQLDVLFPTDTHPAGAEFMSPTCLILMTTDGSVTIVNNQGVADRLTRDDIQRDFIAASCTLLVPAEMIASDVSRDAVDYAIDIALEANRKVAISLNNLYFDAQHKFLRKADFIFANRTEFAHNFPDTTIAALKDADAIHIVTKGPDGADIAGRGNLIHVPALDLVPSAQTATPSFVGAGDQFAAGFLFGFARRLPYADCGRLGAETAAAVLRSTSARPKGDWTGVGARYVRDASNVPS